MTKFTENDLVENKELRDKNLERIEVLSKVKEVVLFPNTELMTTKMVSSYYEIELKTLQKIIERNKLELETNGLIMKSYAEIKDILKADDVSTLKIPRRGTYFFSKRAVLNIGMLLTESTIALEVRNQILNGFELLTDEQKTATINEEEELMLNIIRAGNDTMKLAVAMNELNNFHNRHKDKLNERIEEMKPKEEAFESFINADGFQNMKQVSNSLGIGRNKLFEFLRSEKVLTQSNIPYQRFINQEYFIVKQNPITKGGFSTINTQTFVTAKGVTWIDKLLKNNSVATSK